MQLYPAIDLKDGKCVRLRQGLFSDVKTYSDDPAEMAARWAACGATFLHVVDLDGALKGQSVNLPVIREIRRKVDIPIEIGGGIRSAEAAKILLDAGIDRVIVGTKAVKDPAFMRRLVDTFGPDAVAAGVDAKNGIVAVEGWEALSGVGAEELCLRMKADGVRHIIYTDISRDGAMRGTNREMYRELSETLGLQITASGGVSTLEDVESLRKMNLYGAIIGKAYYTGDINLKKAIETAR